MSEEHHEEQNLEDKQNNENAQSLQAGKNKEEEQLEKLNQINERFDNWEERLKHEDEEISKLENQIDLKMSFFESIENNLKIIENRQSKFDELLRLYESQTGNPIHSRFEILEKAKSLTRNLEDHQHKIDAMNQNITTLQQMIYLVSDSYCKYSKLKRMIPHIREGEIDYHEEEEEEDFENPEEEGIENQDEEI